MDRCGAKPSKPDPSGRPTTGRIVRIVRGQGHAFIRAADGREVFFHRSDVMEGTFNALAVGDVVAFELIEDQVCAGVALVFAGRG
jgi:cold shock CspA family protein